MLRSKIENRSVHLNVWLLLASIEKGTCDVATTLTNLKRIDCYDVNSDKVEQYFESLKFDESYVPLTQSKIFCLIFSMYSRDETQILPFTPELKVLFQIYLDKLVKKYQYIRVPVFQPSISVTYWTKLEKTKLPFFALLRMISWANYQDSTLKRPSS